MQYKLTSSKRSRKTCEIDDLLWFKAKVICTYQKESLNNFINAAILEFIGDHEKYYDKNHPKRANALKAAVEAYNVEIGRASCRERVCLYV